MSPSHDERGGGSLSDEIESIASSNESSLCLTTGGGVVGGVML